MANEARILRPDFQMRRCCAFCVVHFTTLSLKHSSAALHSSDDCRLIIAHKALRENARMVEDHAEGPRRDAVAIGSSWRAIALLRPSKNPADQTGL
jgi:hypothetical protein